MTMTTIAELLEDKSRQQRKKKVRRVQPSLSFGELSYYTYQRPTVAVMTREQARSFNVKGLYIARAFATGRGQQLPEALRKAILSIKGTRIDLLVDGQLKTIYTPRAWKTAVLERSRRTQKRNHHSAGLDTRHFVGPVMMSVEYGTEFSTDEDGTPVVTIILRSPVMPVIKFRTEYEDEEQSSKEKRATKPTPSGDGDHTFLKAPLTDDLLIEALRLADEALFSGKHVGKVKWEEEPDHHEEPFSDHHLLVCLFFYIYFHGYFSSDKFYFSQRKLFFDYCTSRLAGFSFNGLRSFQKTINGLQTRKLSFEQYYKSQHKPTGHHEAGKPNLRMWHVIYQKAADSFEKAFMPRQKA